MNFLNIFKQNIDSQDITSIGQFECAPSKLSLAVSSLLQRMGMSNPSSLTAHSPKGIQIASKGGKFIITLYMFNPPVEIEWTEMDSIENLQSYLENIVDTQTKIGYINLKNTAGNITKYQLGISK